MEPVQQRVAAPRWDRTTECFERVRSGEDGALDQLCEHIGPFLHARVRSRLAGRCRVDDAEDLAGDVWLVVLRRLGDLRPRGGHIAPVLGRFVGTTVERLVANLFRRRARERAARDRLPEPAGVADCADALATTELARRITGAIAGLPETSRQVLELRLLEGLSNEAAAERLAVLPNTAAVRYRRAMHLLRHVLQVPDDDPVAGPSAAGE